jgi:uncharacterized repeat protein (TIGR01451 family)
VPNGTAGVYDSTAVATVIGSTTITTSFFNVISGNGQYGIQFAAGASGQSVRGNLIGTNAAGTGAVGNGTAGIYAAAGSGAAANTIGGTSTGDRNVISGNGLYGVWLVAPSTAGWAIQQNFIGPSANINPLLPNGSHGVYVTGSGALNATVGTTGTPSSFANNWIVQNGGAGVYVSASASGVRVRGNTIYGNGALGIDLAPTGVTANDGAAGGGVANNGIDFPVVTSASLSGTTLTVDGYVGAGGGSATFGGATIDVYRVSADASGHGQASSWLGSFNLWTDGTMKSSTITGVTGLSTGDRITATADLSTGTSEFGANVVVAVASGSVAGVVFEDVNYGGGAGRARAAAAGSSVRSGVRMELYDANGGFLATTTTDASGNYAFSALAAGTYHVRAVNATVITSRGINSGSLMTGFAPVQTYITDASTGTAVGVTNAVGGTDPAAADAANGASGAAFNTGTFVFTSGAAAGGTAMSVALVAVATSSTAVAGVDFGFSFDAVVNTNNTGQGSLRQAMTFANQRSNTGLAQAGLTAGVEHVVFMIPNGTGAPGLRGALNLFAGGVATLAPTSALPSLTDALVLNAQLQPGWSGAPVVEIDGTSAGASAVGLQVAAAGSAVRGFAVNRFGSHGISVTAGAGSTVAGNHVGTNPAGTAAQANGGDGIHVSASANTVGGTTSADRNVVSGNGGAGINVNSAAGTVVQGNYVGTNAAGTAALGGNATGGVLVYGSSTLVGGTAAGAANVISGNGVGSSTGGDGLVLGPGGITSSVIQGNVIGLDAGGAAAVGNARDGVSVLGYHGAGSATVGGTAAGAGNRIAHNGRHGVYVQQGTNGIALRGNAVWANAGLGIDLDPTGVTSNTGAKSSGSANLGMNFPVVTSASLAAGTLTVAGYVGSAAGQGVFAGARVEVFASDDDASGYGEGRTYLGALTADASGHFSGALAAGAVVVGDRLTATATDSSGNTSEFGRHATVTPPAAVAVAPDATTAARLPSNGVVYTDTFTVTNGAASADTFALAAAALPGAVLAVSSVNGTAGAAGGVALAGGASAGVPVTYTVAAAAAGAADTLRLTATSQNSGGTVAASGRVTVTVVRAHLAITRAAYRDDRATAIDPAESGRVQPGEYVQLRVQVTNGGAAAASGVKVVETLPAQLAYDAAEGDAAGWSFAPAASALTADLSAPLAAGASRHFWIRVRVR